MNRNRYLKKRRAGFQAVRFCPFREEAVLADIFTFFAKFDHPVISTEIGFFLFFGKKEKNLNQKLEFTAMSKIESRN